MLRDDKTQSRTLFEHNCIDFKGILYGIERRNTV